MELWLIVRNSTLIFTLIRILGTSTQIFIQPSIVPLPVLFVSEEIG